MNSIQRCPLKPGYESIQTEVKNVIEEVLQSGWYTLGPNVKLFEKEFSNYIGCEYGIGVNSGTDALILSLWALDLKPDDEVITTPFSFYATYLAIKRVGAIPVFVDIDPDTWLIDLKQLEGAITSKTKAIIPVHLFGNVVDINQLRKIIGDRNIVIIEDCAQSHGAKLNGNITGSLGDIGAFSFFPSKNLGCYGDGGMVVTNNFEFAERIKEKRTFGMIDRDTFNSDGINSRLDELQAAILRVKLKYLDNLNMKRRQLAKMYKNLLNPEYIKIQKTESGVESVVHVFSVLAIGRRNELIEYLEKFSIQTNVYYIKPIYRQPGYTKYYKQRYNLPNVENVCNNIIALPFYPEMPDEIIHFVSTKINEFFEMK